jgi:hypothetical protein
MMTTESWTFESAPVVELRQYALKPGAAGALVEVFEAHFVEGQEAAGMRIGGLFHDRDDPDKFVWMRGFPSMEGRRDALTAFYGGPVWKAQGPAANATMVDTADVLLLRPTHPPHQPLAPGPRAPIRAVAGNDEWVLVTVLLHAAGRDTCAWLARDVQPILQEHLGMAVATWRTEPAENTFPALPVRPDHAFVWTATFADKASYGAALERLDGSPAWQEAATRLEALDVVTGMLRLRPTARSAHPPACSTAGL